MFSGELLFMNATICRSHEQLKEELERQAGQRSSPRQRIGSRPWWRRPIRVVALLLGALVVWLASLVVALALLSP